MILPSSSKRLLVNLLIGLLFVLEQTKSRAGAQDVSTRKLRLDTRLSAPKPSNTSLTTAGLRPARDSNNLASTNAYQNIPLANSVRRHDQIHVNYSRGLGTSPKMLQDASNQYDTRIPFWNIAHMINSISEIDQALK